MDGISARFVAMGGRSSRDFHLIWKPMEKRAGVPTEREENDCRNAHSPELPTSSLPPKSSYIRGVASAERKSVESARVRKGRRIPTKRETDGDVDCRFLVGHAFPNLVALLVHDETADRRCVNTAVCTVISRAPSRPDPRYYWYRESLTIFFIVSLARELPTFLCLR